ncbi:hypothetical protein crov026 [Cafeteria roenbergensis virus]|uniref:Uncharacterized protein n=1 Tax=Cafeteria roenbergensis virus (strain BV-PW1) TaxID=693272 RepID=E3T4E6_CROVB|nr:hypothetical protein crov026 [Cafeteria roenbergensis virus BV-PW1]ADO67059.1 hypothetical protein crov026 [Cafeteria roenbergensis virus BV-PW1]
MSMFKSVISSIFIKHNNNYNYHIKHLYGGTNNKVKTLKLEYDGKIELEYKIVSNDKEIDVFISNYFDIDKLIPDNSCLSIKISKIKHEAHIEGISTDKFSCFKDTTFQLKNQGKFYVTMTIKMLKKYKDKFNINKITLHDNAIIKSKKGDFNLSQFKLLTEGCTWYEKFGFKIDKKYKQQHQINKDIIEKLKIKDINIIGIITDILNKTTNEIKKDYIKNVIKNLEENQDEKLTVMLYFIFTENKNKYSSDLYLLIIDDLLKLIETIYSHFDVNLNKNKIYYERYKPANYYMKI